MDSKKFERLRAEAVKASKWRSTSADLSFRPMGRDLRNAGPATSELVIRFEHVGSPPPESSPGELSGVPFYIDAAKNMIEVIDALSRRERESELYPICANCGGRHKTSPYDTGGLFKNLDTRSPFADASDSLARAIDKQILAELLKPPEVAYGERRREADVRKSTWRDLEIGNRRYENRMDGLGWRRWGAKEYVGDELADMLNAMWKKGEEPLKLKPNFVTVDSPNDEHRHVLNRHTAETVRSTKRSMIELQIKHGSDVRPWGSYPGTFTEATR